MADESDKTVRENIELARKEFERKYYAIDTNRDGVIDRGEVAAASSSERLEKKYIDASRLFAEYFDTQDEGKHRQAVTVSEEYKALTYMRDNPNTPIMPLAEVLQKLEANIKAADFNANSVLSQSEKIIACSNSMRLVNFVEIPDDYAAPVPPEYIQKVNEMLVETK